MKTTKKGVRVLDFEEVLSNINVGSVSLWLGMGETKKTISDLLGCELKTVDAYIAGIPAYENMRTVKRQQHYLYTANKAKVLA